MALLITTGALSAWCWAGHAALHRESDTGTLLRLAQVGGLGATALMAALATWLLLQSSASLLAAGLVGAAVALVVGYALPYALARWRAPSARLFRAPLSTVARLFGMDADHLTAPHVVDEQVAANMRGFGDLELFGLMVERTAIQGIDETASLDELRARFQSTGHSRLLVYRETLDNVTGVAFAFDLFDDPQSLSDVVREPFFVRVDMPVDALLRAMITGHHSLAVVMDDFGGTAGLVAREDLLEALFGDIRDEFDADEVMIRRAGPDTLIAVGRIDVETLATHGVVLPEGEYETLAGYLLGLFDHIPRAQESVDVDGYRFTILDSNPSRIDLVRITRAD